MRRRLVPLAACLALCGTVSANAATAAKPKLTPLYFSNVGAPAGGGCTMDPVLSTTQQDGNECSGTYSGVNGQGVLENDTYTTRKKTFRIDATKPLTGTVYLAHFPLIYGSVGPASTPHSLPGYIVADVTYKLDSVTIGTQHIEGVVMPVDGIKSDFSFKIPTALNKKVVSKVSAAVTFTTAVGLSGVSYSAPYASKIVLPTR